MTLPGPAADLVVLTAGTELHLASAWGLMGKFDGEFGAGTQTDAGTARAMCGSPSRSASGHSRRFDDDGARSALPQ